ncbi:hypothetical protein MTBBW1_350022 [Desulfamplus magnetovallimortis]|uniref:Uncharacterized protein n=1 Tax=Desulfamplus magnetovallimortis TaxID=1246637 RepID=A0A1W1HG95_9BACT|nr:hypothetical protein MTBBW1_350022 [Desulfamplus magnetovallimortis]
MGGLFHKPKGHPSYDHESSLHFFETNPEKWGFHLRKCKAGNETSPKKIFLILLPQKSIHPY